MTGNGTARGRASEDLLDPQAAYDLPKRTMILLAEAKKSLADSATRPQPPSFVGDHFYRRSLLPPCKGRKTKDLA